MSGFVKHDQGKLDFSLLPAEEMEQVVGVLTRGAEKYAPGNWQKGTQERYLAACLRHVFARMKGEVVDGDFGYHHTAHAICCLLFIMWLDTNKKQGFVPLASALRNQIARQTEKTEQTRSNTEKEETQKADDGAKMGRNPTPLDEEFFGATIYAMAEAMNDGEQHNSERVRIRAYELFETHKNQPRKGDQNASH